MATFKRVAGGHQAQICVKGRREAMTFSTKAEAREWATQREAELRRQTGAGINADKLMGDAFGRYEKEVSVGKKNYAWEVTRLAWLGRQKIDGREFKSIALVDVTSDMIGKWRDHRLNVDKVAGSTINRDLNLLSNVFWVAKTEWKWVAERPTKDVRRPKNPPSRSRTFTNQEIERITFASGFDEAPVTKIKQAACVAFLFALETAMRAGEIVGLLRKDVTGNVANLYKTKNGSDRRVPLSPRAIELLNFLPAGKPDDPLFGLNSGQLDANFRKLTQAAAIEDATFHDARHHAITRLAKKLDVLELARTVGHRDLNMLMIYYNETAENLAARLAT